MKKLDPNIRPFWKLLRARAQQQNRETNVIAYFRRRPELSCTIDFSQGVPWVPLTQELRALFNTVDREFVLNRMSDQRYQNDLRSAWSELTRSEKVPLNRVAVGVFGPLKAPGRTSHRYNVYVEFYLLRKAVAELLGEVVLRNLKDGVEKIKIQQLAALCEADGLLEEFAGEDDAEDAAFQGDEEDVEEVEEDSLSDEEKELDNARNQIWFGPPGTGKSHGIASLLKRLNVSPSNIFRMTFHPETTYFDLVGSFRPHVAWVADQTMFSKRPPPGQPGEPRTYYQFAPGPLSLALRAASKTKDYVALVIEEINRGNCAAIFGDVFQLLDRLDRNEKGEELGRSVYGITPQPEWTSWLADELDPESRILDDYQTLRLPQNLLIFASMNTSDQNLFPMDSAFKRRWSMKYVPIEKDPKTLTQTLQLACVPLRAEDSEGVLWLKFLSTINKIIVQHTRSDDKQIGPWFVPFMNSWISEENFRSKVLYYLWNDVFRDNTSLIFSDTIQTYEQLVARYKAGSQIFSKDFRDRLSDLG